MNKFMNTKNMILVLTLAALSSVANAQDKNSERSLSGGEVLAVGATTSTDSCLCNTVGKGLQQPVAPNTSYDYLLNAENPKAGGSEAAPADGQDGVN